MKPVGFDQKIKFQYLDHLAKSLKSNKSNNIYSILDEALRTSIKGEKSRKNAITILMKIWVKVELRIEDIQQELIKEYSYLSEAEQRCVHYCLTCIAYPFYREQMNHLGKHLRMADTVNSKVLISQMKDLYGDRRRVEVASSSVLSSSRDWEMISMVKQGTYGPFNQMIQVNDKLVKSLMIEVLMHHLSTDTIELEMLNNSAIFFPFDYHVTPGDIDTQRFSIINNIRDTLIERNSVSPYSIE